ncbi:unannotated protein [freshwater metagenome]|uniref:Unannotated protein n=1 Tax=freshwater metagenome TaxID=449393 RepID=A0A6J7F600_9ZZZZ|nr:hypothetical protein [Actinomycetota bacterium]
MNRSTAQRAKLTTSQILARTAVILSVLFLLGMWVYAFGGFATRKAAAKIDDRAWTKRAEQICVQRNALLATNADEIRKTTDGSPQAVGRGVKAATDLIEAAQNEIMTPKPTSAHDVRLVDTFDSLYRTYIADRRATEARLAKGEKAELNETMLNGSPVSETIADFTRPNLMDSCAVPAQF